MTAKEEAISSVTSTKLKAYNIDLYPLLALYFTRLYKTTEILTSIYEAYILSGICI